MQYPITFPSREQRRRAPRFYGWRIRIQYPGQAPSTMPTIWAEVEPCIWQQVKANPALEVATLFKSGKAVDRVNHLDEVQSC